MINLDLISTSGTIQKNIDDQFEFDFYLRNWVGIVAPVSATKADLSLKMTFIGTINMLALLLQ